MVRSLANQSAFGPVSPNALMVTVTSPGLAARRAPRSTPIAWLSSTTSAVEANATRSTLLMRTERLPRL